jgi:hypothetical protein
MSEDELDHQQTAIALCDGFTPLDQAALTRLGPEDLTAQFEARLELFEYVDALWDQAKAAGRDPANNPAYTTAAALRDLIAELLSNAEEAGGS